MAELVAGALLTAVLDKLFERLASPEFRRNLTGYKLKQLESELNDARPFLNDAENRQLRDERIKEWLGDLKHVVFQADDLSEEIHHNKNRKSRMKSLKSTYHSLVARGEIGEILTELVVLLDRAKVLGLNRWDGSARETRSSSSTIKEEHHVFGRADDKEKVLELLLSLSDSSFGGHRIRVVPIVGMGGIGKTTLAQLVYNDIRVKESEFELRAWVYVSSEFDVVKIIKTVLQTINPGVLESEIEELSALQRRMKDTLRGKKFLLVLDDVWTEDYHDWDLLMSVFSFGAPGSTIVVTTRSRKVGSMVSTVPVYELSGMSNDDCWSIFVDHAFIGGDSNIDPRLQKIGRDIVMKCHGLPLAVKTIAGLLRSRTALEDWVNVLKHHVWEWDRHPSDGVLPSLWLSYQYLPSSLKQCFAYCSVFPADYKFHKEEMVLLWMAEGFLHTHGRENQSMEEIGEQYFEVLVSRSFFQRYDGDESMFLMHDLIHNLAVVVSGEFCVSFDSEYVNFDRVTKRTRHLSHTNNVSFDSTMLWTSVSKAKHLRTFLSLSKYGDFTSEFVGKLITNQRRLRVLSLHTQDSISVSFRNLKHLRYLNLSRSTIVKVPSSVCALVNLETLLLSECSSLTRLPGKTRKLKKLRHLDITGANLRNMPPQMGDLIELRTLTNFVLDDSDGFACSKIKEIGELQHLRKLRISKLQNVAVSKDGKDILRSKEKLKELALEWDDNGKSETRGDAKVVLDALQPHTNLEKLVIWNYPDSSFPAWVGELSELVSVELKGVFCESLPPLWQLRHLLKLVIQGFEVVETIGLELYTSSSITPFECLKTLEFRGMKRLKEWVFIDKAFPCLKDLSLIECPELMPFPEAGFPKSLHHLHIKSCTKLMAQQSCFDQLNVPSLVSLSIESCCSDSSSSSELFAGVLLPESLASLKLVNLGGFKSINGSAFGQAQSLVHVTIRECNELESLPEKELPSSLSTLKIYNCRLLERKYGKGKGEGYQHISQIPYLSIFGDTTVEMD